MNLEQMAASLATLGEAADTSAGAPVEAWSPSFCGDIPLTICTDGTWTYMGTPITRGKLVKLFASVLLREDEHYYLVTPVEKVGIVVEDVPFVVVQWSNTDSSIQVMTQSGEQFAIDENHPVELRPFPQGSDTLIPYVKVRRNLWARFHQNVFYQMIDQAEEIPVNEKHSMRLSSNGYEFELGQY